MKITPTGNIEINALRAIGAGEDPNTLISIDGTPMVKCNKNPEQATCFEVVALVAGTRKIIHGCVHSTLVGAKKCAAGKKDSLIRDGWDIQNILIGFDEACILLPDPATPSAKTVQA